ncbi:hypothetical protein EVAR_95047_1 [Eumeta japonica]|uniref:Uncharacterized protein n=1 Tax=Eumeta variegata TaxID=151549 RepID=A0A4C1W8W2_EUMVA|nr:hypothetical protein EVAR_95047_1 [Eumeta japonica]
MGLSPHIATGNHQCDDDVLVSNKISDERQRDPMEREWVLALNPKMYFAISPRHSVVFSRISDRELRLQSDRTYTPGWHFKPAILDVNTKSVMTIAKQLPTRIVPAQQV